jgi:hypothetical protein
MYEYRYGELHEIYIYIYIYMYLIIVVPNTRNVKVQNVMLERNVFR